MLLRKGCEPKKASSLSMQRRSFYRRNSGNIAAQFAGTIG